MSWQRSVQEEGFAVIADVLEPAGLDRLISSVDLPVDNSSRGGIRHLMLIRAVAGLAHDWRLLSIAQQVLGIEAFPFRATLFGKSPGPTGSSPGIKTRRFHSREDSQPRGGVHGR